MNYLIYDVSGHRAVTNWKAPFTDTFNWPKIIHISWLLLDESYKPISDFNAFLAQPELRIGEEMLKSIHIEIADYDADKSDSKQVMQRFADDIEKADYIFSFNQEYNENMAGAEFLRSGVKHSLFKKENYCLMRESTFYCALPGKGGKYKWPSLSELHAILFRQKYTPPGNARADVIAAARCFIKLRKLGELDDLFEL